MKEGKCVDKAPNKRLNPTAPDLWFPEKGEPTNPGKIICFTCPVRTDCNDYRARTGTRFGMWAGEIRKPGK